MDIFTQDVIRAELLQAVFATFDVSGSGVLSLDELNHLASARRTLKQRDGIWNNRQNQALMKEINVNTDGKVTEQEFVDACDKSMSNDLEEFIRLVLEFGEVCVAAP